MHEPFPSPFIPGTNIQFAWDSTSIGLLKRCPRLYQYMQIEGWSPPGEAIHLRFGIEVHKVTQEYDQAKAAGMSHNEAVHEVVHNLLKRIYDWHPEPTTDSEKIKSKANLIRAAVWYMDEYKDDPAKTMMKDDGSAAVELSFRFELDWGSSVVEKDVNGHIKAHQPYLLCGHLDRVVEFADGYYVMDRKSTTTTPGSYFFNQFEPDNQMTLYILASQVILEATIKGVIIECWQIAVGFSRFVRGFTYRTNEQLEEWLKDLKTWLEKAEDYAIEGYWPMNDTACDKYGGCRFRQICSKSPPVREQFLKSNFVKGEPWNPLIPR